MLDDDAPFHIHFSDIAYANQNETKHLPYGKGTLRAEPLAAALTADGSAGDDHQRVAGRRVTSGHPRGARRHDPSATAHERVAREMSIEYSWRGEVSNAEVNELHARAFETRIYDETEWDWHRQLEGHSLGWVVARDGGRLVGFVNVPWDGLVHAWIQDTMVAESARRQGVAVRLISIARDRAKEAGCEWLHVDFDEHLRPLYIDACGFTPAPAGVMALQADPPPKQVT